MSISRTIAMLESETTTLLCRSRNGKKFVHGCKFVS